MSKLKQTKKVELLKNPKYYLAIVALFRDEARFLKEWIEFHKLMGVEHFYLYNHLSKDNYLEVLAPYIEQGLVELSHLTYEPKIAKEWYHLVQFPSYMSTKETVKNDVEWLAIIDTDEFLYPIKEKNLTDLLKKYDEFACLSAHWIYFGSNNITRLGENELMIEKLNMMEKEPSRVVKSVVKPRYVESIKNAHQPLLKDGYVPINENYSFFINSKDNETSTNIVAVNHYVYRDLDFYYNVKLSRVHKTTGLNETGINLMIEKDLYYNKKKSAVYSDNILRFVPALKEQMFKNAFNNSNLEHFSKDNSEVCLSQEEESNIGIIGELTN